MGEKFHWYYVTHEGFERTERAPVFGGWIVKVTDIMEERNLTISMVFVPDPLHAWEVE